MVTYFFLQKFHYFVLIFNWKHHVYLHKIFLEVEGHFSQSRKSWERTAFLTHLVCSWKGLGLLLVALPPSPSSFLRATHWCTPLSSKGQLIFLSLKHTFQWGQTPEIQQSPLTASLPQLPWPSHTCSHWPSFSRGLLRFALQVDYLRSGKCSMTPSFVSPCHRGGDHNQTLWTQWDTI